MSNNPYSSPTNIPHQPGMPMNQPGYGKKPMPAILITICIFAITIGSFGFIFTGCGAFGLVMQSSMQANNPAADATVNKRIADMQKAQFIPNLIFILLNFFIAPSLVIGATGCLMRKQWGRSVLQKTCIVAAIFVFLRTAVGIVMQVVNMDTMIEMQKRISPASADMFESFFYIGLALGVIIFLVFFTYYLFSAWYLGKPEIKAFFAT